MLNMLMFSVIFVTVQMVGGLFMLKLFTSKWYMKKITKMTKELTEELMDEMQL